MAEKGTMADERRIRKVVVFYEDDTRQPVSIDGAGYVQKVSTEDDMRGAPSKALTYYNIVITPPQQ